VGLSELSYQNAPMTGTGSLTQNFCAEITALSATKGGAMDLREWLTEHQAADHVGRSRRTLQIWRQSGEVTAYRQARSLILYDRESLEQCASVQAMRYRKKVGRPATTQ
jgi:hypothetical protein